MQIARFRAGLKAEIKEYIKMINTFTLGEAFDTVRKTKEPVKPVSRGRYSSQQFQAAHNKVVRPSKPGAGIAGAGVTGAGSGTNGPMLSTCYWCHQLGHHSNQCPLRPTVNLVEDEDGEEYMEDEDVVEGIEDDGKDFMGMVQ
ncbi:hypothetical protein LWI28_001266 [Acer negundo]|uniref:CCHC-type domain-containing protein n=1 Tax=Acer negundo TaxID=4023 RepID=A0AAD5NE11_ACENE|nr:hypothetical protein LWI28_001266 [Acer negundo]